MTSLESSETGSVEIENDETPFDEPLAMALCPTPCCSDTLVFTASATAVQCQQCGLVATSLNFDDANIEPIFSLAQFKFVIQRRRVREKKETIGGFPRMVHASIDSIHGRYHERLLEPLFLHCGWDRAQEAVQLLEKGGPSPIETFRASCFAINERHLAAFDYGQDTTAAGYLRAVLKAIDEANGSEMAVMTPLIVQSGCLLDAISRSLTGRQLLSSVLRVAMNNELQTNADAYKRQLGDSFAEEEWTRAVCESEVGPLKDLSSIHVAALANVLERPIVLLDNLPDGKSRANTFLPLLRCKNSSDEKVDSCCATTGMPPIVIAWANAEHTRFVPLAAIQRSNSNYPDVRMSGAMIPPVWGVNSEKLSREALQTHLQFESDGRCVLMRRHNWFTAEDLRPIVEAYNVAEAHGIPIHLGLFADYIEDTPGATGAEFKQLIHACRKASSQMRLLQCQECGKVTELRRVVSGLEPLDDTQRLCGQCFTLGNRRVKTDGTVMHMDGDHTSRPAPRSSCRQKRKHYWNGKEYDNPPTRISVCFTIRGEEVKEIVPWFEGEVNTADNSNAEDEAARLLEKHAHDARDTAKVSEVARKIRAALDALAKEVANESPPEPWNVAVLGIELDDFPSRYSEFVKWSEMKVDECPLELARNLQAVSKASEDATEMMEKTLAILEASVGDRSSDNYWRVVCALPKLFKAGGAIFELAKRRGLLRDGCVFTLPMLDGKEFVCKSDAIEWRVPELSRSFPIGPLTRSFVRGWLQRRQQK